MSCIMDGTELEGVCLEQDCCYWDGTGKKCIYIPLDHRGGIIDSRNPEKLAGKKEKVG